MCCVNVSYYFASGPSGICRFQKNSSSIFMWVYAFINVAANCLRSNSQLVSAFLLVCLADRGANMSYRKRGWVIRGGWKWREQRERRNRYIWHYVSKRWKGDFEKRRERSYRWGQKEKKEGGQKKRERVIKDRLSRNRRELRYPSYFGLSNEPKVSWICPELPKAQSTTLCRKLCVETAF